MIHSISNLIEQQMNIRFKIKKHNNIHTCAGNLNFKHFLVWPEQEVAISSVKQGNKM